MANIDAAFGLKPLRHLNGNPWNGATEKCLVEDDYAVALYVGDIVIYTGTAGADVTTGHHKVVNVATVGDGNAIYGVITSIEPNPADLSKTYLPASTGGYVYVCVDPKVIFAVQDDGGAVLDGGSIGAMAILANAAGGSTTTGLSGMELAAASTPGTNQSYQLLIMGVHAKENNAFGINCIWEVLISNHHLLPRDTSADGGLLGI
jgi:hypothetical protein